MASTLELRLAMHKQEKSTPTRTKPEKQDIPVSQKRITELFYAKFRDAVKQTKKIHHNKIVPETLKYYLAKAISHPDFIRQITPSVSPSYKVYLKVGNKLRTMRGEFLTEQSAEKYIAHFCRETYVPRSDLFIISTCQQTFCTNKGKNHGYHSQRMGIRR